MREKKGRREERRGECGRRQRERERKRRKRVGYGGREKKNQCVSMVNAHFI